MRQCHEGQRQRVFFRIRNYLGRKRNHYGGVLRETLSSNKGMGVVEVILIIVVLIGLVIIFQTNIKSVVASIFSTIQTNAGQVR